MRQPKDMVTIMPYIERNELYDREKLYAADFEVDVGQKATNHIFAQTPVLIHDIVSFQDFDLDTHGFCVLKEETTLKAEDALDRPQEVEASYCSEIEILLHKHFPEYSRIESMDFIVRTSHHPISVLELIDAY
jgi:hypothetical protein